MPHFDKRTPRTALSKVEGGFDQHETEADAIVVGAGPAGLAAASALVKRRHRVVLVESGPDLDSRHRDALDEQTAGVGGAGLYSDGKFSFAPSASKLWELTPRETLAVSYDWYLAQLQPIRWSDTLSRRLPADPPPVIPTKAVIEKQYPSHYASPAERDQLTRTLWAPLQESAFIGATIDDTRIRDGRFRVDLRQDGRSVRIIGKAMIFAVGRLGPLSLLKAFPDLPWNVGRTEIGVRLEQPTREFILGDHVATDPKIIVHLADGAAARTFCCCREGEVIATRTSGIVTVSGRADCPATGRSNVGVLVRLTDAALAADPSLLDRALDAGSAIRISLEDFRSGDNDLSAVLGPLLSAQINETLDRLEEHTGRDLHGATIHGIAVEGVGSYPALRTDLRWDDEPLWVAGDATGLFRGITAAFVSGYFAGLRASAHLSALS